MPAITPLNVGLLPVSGHTDVSQQGRQRTERATISSNDSTKKPLQNRHFCDGSMNSLCDRQYHPCAKMLRINGALPPHLHAFTLCTRTLTPPPSSIHRCVVSLLKCTARIYCRSPFRNTAICQASSTRSFRLSDPLYPFIVLCSVTYYYTQPESFLLSHVSEHVKTLRPSTENWYSRVQSYTMSNIT